MLSKNKQKLIKELHRAKGRAKHGLCLVEGEKNLQMAEAYLEFTFNRDEVDDFDELVTTQAPQDVAGVARVPGFGQGDIVAKDLILALDNLQDPGNVGAALRLALAFEASVLLVESVDPTNPKVIRSSAGAMFKAPWLSRKRDETLGFLNDLKNHQVYRLEQSENAVFLSDKGILKKPAVIIAGNEGSGIGLPVSAPALSISHNQDLESLNVAQALSITAWRFYNL